MKKQFFAGIILAMILLAGCTVNPDNPEGTTRGAPPEPTLPVITGSVPDTVPSVPASETDPARTETEPTDVTGNPDEITVSVRGIVLKYPAKWLDVLTIETEEDAVHFSSLDVPLFDLFFDGRGKTLGTLQSKDSLRVGLEMFTQDQEDLRISSMRDDVNYILDNLRADYGFVVAKEDPSDAGDVFPIETSVVTLYYPAKWKDSVEIEVKEDSVLFSAEGTKLFELVFRESEGYYLGSYNETPIWLRTYELSDDTHFAMQEDVNVIVEHLLKDERFIKG